MAKAQLSSTLKQLQGSVEARAQALAALQAEAMAVQQELDGLAKVGGLGGARVDSCIGAEGGGP